MPSGRPRKYPILENEHPSTVVVKYHGKLRDIVEAYRASFSDYVTRNDAVHALICAGNASTSTEGHEDVERQRAYNDTKKWLMKELGFKLEELSKLLRSN